MAAPMASMAPPLFSAAAAAARLAAARPAATLFGRTAVRIGMRAGGQPALAKPSANPFANPFANPSAARPFSAQPLARPVSAIRPSFPQSHSHGQSRQSRSHSRQRTTPLWALAAAAPVAIASSDTEAAAAAVPAPGLIVPPPPRRQSSARGPPRLPLDPHVASEVSKGSFSGFALGLLVSVFSRTLVFLLGLAITLQTLASKVGIDLAHHLKIKERVTSSKILSALNEHAAFKLSFGLTFTMAAFMHF